MEEIWSSRKGQEARKHIGKKKKRSKAGSEDGNKAQT
jgi:hypothetical protein